EKLLLLGAMALELGGLLRGFGVERHELILEAGERRLVLLRRLGGGDALVAQRGDIVRERIGLLRILRRFLPALLDLLLDGLELLLRRFGGVRDGTKHQS